MNKTAIKLIEWYQGDISPQTVGRCRHMPTCSQYAKEAFIAFSFPKAFYLTTKRILSCNPLFKPKYDPVIKKEKKDA